WADLIADQASREARKQETRRIRSEAGKHRRKAAGAEIGSKRTGGGTLIGGSNDPRERAAAGLNPVAGLDVSLEDADSLVGGNSGVTATVAALTKLITEGNPLIKQGKIWTPHRPARPEKSEGGIPFRMVSDYAPAGDQPTAI